MLLFHKKILAMAKQLKLNNHLCIPDPHGRIGPRAARSQATTTSQELAKFLLASNFHTAKVFGTLLAPIA